MCAAVGVSIIVFLLVIGIIVFLVWKKHRTSKEQDTQPTTELELSSPDDSKTEPGPGLQV